MLLTEGNAPTKFSPTLVQPIDESVLVEDAQGNKKPMKGLLRVQGVFQRYDIVNANGRKYPKELWERVLKEEYIGEAFRTRSMLSLLEHPEDGMTKLDRVPCACILWARDNNDGSILGEALIINTSTGRDLAAIFEAGCSVGISSRGDGELSMSEGAQTVNPRTYKLATWDFVFDNSVPGARPKVVEDKTIQTEAVKVEPTNPLTEKADPSKDSVYCRMVQELADARKDKNNAKVKQLRDKIANHIKDKKLDVDSDTAASLLADTDESSSNGGQSQEYLSNKSRTPGKSNMSKINEFRLLQLELSRLLPEGRKPNFKNLPFSAKAAMSDSLLDLKRRFLEIQESDKALSSNCDKSLKRLSEAEDALEDMGAPSAPPAGGAPGADGAPGAGTDLGGGDKPPGEQAECPVTCENFCLVLKAVINDSVPGIDPVKLDEFCKTQYEGFCENQSLSGVINAAQGLVDDTGNGGGAPGEEAAGDPMVNVPPAPEGGEPPMEKQLEAALSLITAMGKQLQESNPTNVAGLRNLLREAREQLMKAKGTDTKLKENNVLLKEAGDEIKRLESVVTEQKATLVAAVDLLKKHNITDASILRKVEECDKSTKTEKKETAEEKAVAEKAKKDKEDAEKAEKAKNEAKTPEQKAADEAAALAKQKKKDDDKKLSETKTPEQLAEEAKKLEESSKAPEDHDFLRTVKRQRSGAFHQYNK